MILHLNGPYLTSRSGDVGVSVDDIEYDSGLPVVCIFRDGHTGRAVFNPCMITSGLVDITNDTKVT